MIQKYRKTDAKVRGRAQHKRRAAKTHRRSNESLRPFPFDPIAYEAALEVLG
jgi:hypothetical protein